MTNPRQRRKQKSGSKIVTRRKANAHGKKVVINNRLIEDVWDTQATLRENYVRLGLAVDLNAAVTNKGPAVSSPLIQKLEEAAANEIHEEHLLSNNQADVLQRLIAKHKDDYAAMARDIKINKYQLTAGQLRRNIAKLNAGGVANEIIVTANNKMEA